MPSKKRSSGVSHTAQRQPAGRPVEPQPASSAPAAAETRQTGKTAKKARRRPAGRKAPARTYTVYVIQLSRECVREPCALAPLYVGQTAHTPEHRFAQHKAGGKLAAGKAHRYGEKLRWDLMNGVGPFSTRKEAEEAEKAMAAALEKRGHRVFWG